MSDTYSGGHTGNVLNYILRLPVILLLLTRRLVMHAVLLDFEVSRSIVEEMTGML